MKLTLAQIRKTILVVLLAIIFGGSGYWLGQHQIAFTRGGLMPEIRIERSVPATFEPVDFNLFWEVWDLLSQRYLFKKDLNQAKMVYGAISGMVASLEDPYTVFLPPTENKQAKEDLNGAFEGVGIQLGYKDDQLAVIAPLEGMPAEKAGVKAGDLILRIVDDKKKIDVETTGISLPEAVTLIRGPRGSAVRLTFQREGVEKPFEVELKRETIVVKSVELKFIEQANQKAAHLKLIRFGERTSQEWEEAVREIKNYKTQNPNFAGVILDLRNNPGGFLSGSVYIASEFLGNGVVVQQDKGEGEKETYSVNRQGSLISDPLVVLINKGSASASEIVAGTLQERKRAKLVGEKSFGKGTIQEAQDLKAGAGIHITVARWLLPSDRSIDKEGVTPDFEVKMDERDETKDPQLEKAVQMLIQ